jgi:DNA-binding transcriptional MerR regulator
MGDRQLPQQLTKSFTPAEVAALVGAPVHSIRRWCEYHKEHLSELASPEPGQARRLTSRDIEVLRAVKALRDQGMTVPVINERLQELSFGEINSDPDSIPNSAVVPLAVQDNPDQVETSFVVLEKTLTAVVGPLAARVEALERSSAEEAKQRRDVWLAFGAGVLLTAIFFLIIVLLVTSFR